MEVEVYWDYDEHRYKVNYNMIDSYKVPVDYNGDEEVVFEDDVYFRLIDDMDSLGISSETYAFG